MVRGLLLGALLALVSLVPAPFRVAGAADEEDKAAVLYKEYLSLRQETSWRKSNRRMAIIRRLGGYPGATARQALEKIRNTARSPDERLLAVRSLVKAGDLAKEQDWSKYTSHAGPNWKDFPEDPMSEES